MSETKTERTRSTRLEASGRVTPREVLKAYEETGYKPLFEHWWHPVEDGYEACALTALVGASGVDLAGTPMLEASYCAEDYMEERLPHVHHYYQIGFTAGFDDDLAPTSSGDDHPLSLGSDAWERCGWRDGKRARAFVLARLVESHG